MAPLAVLHVMHAPRRGPFGNDPSYYVQAARHFAEGDGFVTTVSLYEEGINPLPQPFNGYPLWPLVLGAFGRVIGIVAAANVLPQILFIVDLLLFYLLANRLAGDAGITTILGESVDVGHLVALLLGFNFIFFTVTADPYTESLAFALILGSFLLLDRDPAWSGLLAGLGVLTRYQMAVIPAATLLVLLTRRQLPRLMAYGAPVLGVCGAWVLYLRAIAVRHAAIGTWQEWIQQRSYGEQAIHLMKGLLAAVNPASDVSLFHSFGPVVLVIALAAMVVRRRDTLFWSLVLSGVGSIVALANFESIRPPVWLFGSRHSIAFVFLLVPAIVVAMTNAARTVRWITVALAGASFVYGAIEIAHLPTPVGLGLTGADHAMMQWLDRDAPHATLLSTRAQELSVYGNERWHWTHCLVQPAKTRLMLQRLPIDYVVVDDSQRSCAFIRGLDDVLKTEAIFSDELRRVYLLRVIRNMTSTGAPSSVHTATGL